MLSRPSRWVKLFWVLLLLSFLGIFVRQVFWVQENTCLGVIFAKGEPAPAEAPPEGAMLYLDGIPLPFDSAENTFYVSVSSAGENWPGALTFSNPRTALLWEQDDAWQNLDTAIADAYCFPLDIAQNGTTLYTTKVCFVALPLLDLTQPPTADAAGIALPELEKGQTLPMTGRLLQSDGRVQNFSAEAGLHGATSMMFPKKSFSLDVSAASKHLELGSLVTDNNFVLNALYTDASCIKEKLIASRWNQLCSEGGEDYAMSGLEYVLLFADNRCLGLYGMENRLEPKTLDMDKTHDVLYKGIDWAGEEDWNAFFAAPAGTVFASYELKWPKTDTDLHAAWQPLASYRRLFTEPGEQNELTGSNLYNLQNQMDYALFCELFGLYDNVSSRNVYYVAQHNKRGYTLYRVPWDTDISLDFDTLAWRYSEHTAEEFALTDTLFATQEITAILQSVPNAESQYADRWLALSQKGAALDPWDILDCGHALAGELMASGGYSVEDRIWPEHYVSTDLSAFETCLSARSGNLNLRFGLG